MRSGDAVVGPKFNRKSRGKVLAQLVGNGRAPGVSVVDMDVIAVKFGHASSLPAASHHIQPEGKEKNT
jgi:hypothetical protein